MKCLIQSRKQRSNAHRYQQRNKTRPTPCTHQLTLPGFGTKIGTIDIHCKNGGNTVHHRCQRTDNRCRKSSKCNPFYSHRQQVAQQPRISLIRFFQRSIQSKCRNARNNDQQRNQQFDETGKQHTILRLTYRFGSQRTLNDILIASPII